jgi:hypothetical protein
LHLQITCCCIWKYVQVNMFWCWQHKNVFCSLRLSTPASGRHQESGFWNMKGRPSSRITIICDIIPYSEVDVYKLFGILLYLHLQFKN